jgi:sugar/nucleoside kinase (ribokinase family)
VRPLGVIGPLSRDVVAGGQPRVGGAPWHAARALRALRQDAFIFAKCGAVDRRAMQRQLAALGLPVSVTGSGTTAAFSFSYAADGTRTMALDELGEPWSRDDVPEQLLRRVEWLHVGPLVRGDFDESMLAWLARDRRLLLDAQGLVRARELGPLRLDANFDRALLRHVTVLKLAEEEAAVVGDLRELGVAEVIVTDGPRGSRLLANGRETPIPAHPVDGDPTGAGDAFAVTYLASRADGHRPLSAARRATALVAALLGGTGKWG